MERIKKIKTDFNFTPKDEERLKSLLPVMKNHADSFVKHLHKELSERGDSFINKKLKIPSLYEYHKTWFLSLFSGVYDDNYCRRLIKIGKKHALEKIPTHYVNISINIIRDYMMDLFLELFENREERVPLRKSLFKILGINLDIITSSYQEEQISQYSAAYRVKNALMNFAERFSSLMNLVLVLLLIFITVGIVGLFFYDVTNLITSGFSEGLISALGSLLILWVMIELMNTEIDHLKGGKFNISVFISVALVTFIRDLMVVTLKQGKTDQGYYLAVVTFILGIVYWLIKKTEEK